MSNAPRKLYFKHLTQLDELRSHSKLHKYPTRSYEAARFWKVIRQIYHILHFPDMCKPPEGAVLLCIIQHCKLLYEHVLCNYFMRRPLDHVNGSTHLRPR